MFGLVRLLVLPLPVDDLALVDGLDRDRVVAEVFFSDDAVEEVMACRDDQQVERALILVALRDVLVNVERLDRAALDGFPDVLDDEIQRDVTVVLIFENRCQYSNLVVFNVISHVISSLSW